MASVDGMYFDAAIRQPIYSRHSSFEQLLGRSTDTKTPNGIQEKSEGCKTYTAETASSGESYQLRTCPVVSRDVPGEVTILSRFPRCGLHIHVDTGRGHDTTRE